MDTPESIKPHAGDYKDRAWQNYDLVELGQWVHLLVKRAGHRTDLAKRRKDLYDARNYYEMMGAHLDEAEAQAQE